MILFGVRSPLVVDFEETLHRLGIEVSAAVSINGAPRALDRGKIVDLADFVAEPGGLFMATAFSPGRRQALCEQACALGLVPAPGVIDPTAIVPRSLRIGHGSFVNAGVVIGALSIIGNNVLVNRAASLGHHTVLGDFVSVGPGATLAGNIRVGAGSMIGAGSTILPNVRIGDNVIVSAGSIVRKHVPDGAFVVGNPAIIKPFNARSSSLNIEDGE